MASFLRAFITLEEVGAGYGVRPGSVAETYAGISRQHSSTWEGWEILDKVNNTLKLCVVIKKVLDTLVFEYYKTIWDTVEGTSIESQRVATSLLQIAVALGTPKAITVIQKTVRIPDTGMMDFWTITKLNAIDEEWLLVELAARYERHRLILTARYSQD